MTDMASELGNDRSTPATDTMYGADIDVRRATVAEILARALVRLAARQGTRVPSRTPYGERGKSQLLEQKGLASGPSKSVHVTRRG